MPQVFGRYLLVQRLSRGGMGEIFLAKHGLSGFEKLAVIKKVLPNLAADASFISRFVDEAQVAIKLQHVNVAQVFEVGRVGTEYFLALEYVEGRDLRRTLALLGQRKQRIPVDLALFIGREMANGLAYAHRRTSADGASLRLVHCDISPPNILVSFEGETKVIDFGIAKSAIRGTATDPKMGFGKFGYMAPEQLIRGGIVDYRTDIYAGGVVLFELLTGTRLYEPGDQPDYRALARKVAKGEHALPSEYDPQLAPYDDLVATALRPRMEDRYQSAAELRDAIQQSLVGINPTISTDQLGAYMRELFADEMTVQKELHERVAKAHLDDFQDQLTQSTQSVGTVTFALANLPMVTEGEATRTTPRPGRASAPPPVPNTPARGIPAPVPAAATGPARRRRAAPRASRATPTPPADADAAPPGARPAAVGRAAGDAVAGGVDPRTCRSPTARAPSTTCRSISCVARAAARPRPRSWPRRVAGGVLVRRRAGVVGGAATDSSSSAPAKEKPDKLRGRRREQRGARTKTIDYDAVSSESTSGPNLHAASVGIERARIEWRIECRLEWRQPTRRRSKRRARSRSSRRRPVPDTAAHGEATQIHRRRSAAPAWCIRSGIRRTWEPAPAQPHHPRAQSSPEKPKPPAHQQRSRRSARSCRRRAASTARTRTSSACGSTASGTTSRCGCRTTSMTPRCSTRRRGGSTRSARSSTKRRGSRAGAHVSWPAKPTRNKTWAIDLP